MSAYYLLVWLLKKGHTVMQQDVHGELLIEMEDNVYCRDLNNGGYFLPLFFYLTIMCLPFAKIFFMPFNIIIGGK